MRRAIPLFALLAVLAVFLGVPADANAQYQSSGYVSIQPVAPPVVIRLPRYDPPVSINPPISINPPRYTYPIIINPQPRHRLVPSYRCYRTWSLRRY